LAYSCEILADSMAPSGVRLTTMVVTYPRFVHSEFMTHRMFSRNAASSRAIPIKKMIQQVETDPAMPIEWGKQQPGMGAKEFLFGEYRIAAELNWLLARDNAVTIVKSMDAIGLAKQLSNRLLEPFAWITVIVTATEWENFFALRCHPDAQPELRCIAEMMQDAYRDPVAPPRLIRSRDPIPFHLPLVRNEDLEYWAVGELKLWDLVKISVGRCARVSYLTHDGKRDPAADIELHDRLLESRHMSPFEHVASPLQLTRRSGNFVGWSQYRKRVERMLQGEAMWPRINNGGVHGS